MANTIVVDVDAHVAHVTLNRPGKMNAVSLELFAALGETGRTLATDSRVRAVVLHGAGEHFCAGIDTSVVAAGDAGIDATMLAPQEGSPANLFQRAAYIWRELPVPVICAIRGVAYGAGLQIALGADIRYAAPDARFSVMEAKWGLIPDMALSVTARGVVPLDRLKELAYTARVIDAEEALGTGLISRICEDPLAVAGATAAAIAGRSPSAVKAMKQLFDCGWGAPPATALALEASLQAGLLGGENQREAVLANLEKRPPRFTATIVDEIVDNSTD